MKFIVFVPVLASCLLWATGADAASPPTSLDECRVQAAREAKTEIGARVLLADCAKRFPNTPVPPEPSVAEEECRRQGKSYSPERLIGPKCSDDPSQRPCTAEDIAFNAAAQIPKKECEERGGSWSEKQKLCSTAGRPPMIILCKSETGTERSTWRKFGENERLTSYVEQRQPVNTGNVIVWVLYDYKAEQQSQQSGRRYLSQKGQQEVDCTGQRSRTIFFTWHADRMGNGAVVYTGSKVLPWEPNSPGSIAKALAAQVCSSKQ